MGKLWGHKKGEDTKNRCFVSPGGCPSPLETRSETAGKGRGASFLQVIKRLFRPDSSDPFEDRVTNKQLAPHKSSDSEGPSETPWLLVSGGRKEA